jgi:hypothetical protein
VSSSGLFYFFRKNILSGYQEKEKVIETDVVEIIEYTKPLVEKTEGTGTTLSAEDIKKAPTRSIGDLVQLTPGIQGGV